MSLNFPQTTVNNERPVGTTFVSTYSNKHGGVVSESLGPEALAGDLIAEYGDAVDVEHFDLQLDDIDTIVKKLSERRPAIVGVSIKIGGTEQTKQVISAINQLPYKPLLVLGGVVPTFAAVQLLDQYPNAVIAIGEGEMTMRGLVEVSQGTRGLETVPGITYLREGSLQTTPIERIDLAELHLPARITTKRVFDELNGLVWFEGSRGCDWHCTFCSRRELRGDGFSGNISPTHVADDLEILSNLGIKSVHATDDDWGGDPERSLLIAEEVIARGIDIRWSISTRADHIWVEPGPRDNPEQIAQQNNRLRYIMQRHKQAGLDRVFIGLESFSESQLKRYGKQISVQANYRALEVLWDLGIDVVAGYIPIDPLMTLEELNENLVGLRRTNMYRKVTNPLSVLRVQEGSPYLKMIRNREKQDGIQYITDRTNDLVFYDVINYADPRIQVIANLADEWVTEMYPVIFGLKMEVFSSTQDSRLSDQSASYCEALLFRFRELEMEFIETVTRHFLSGGTADRHLTGIVERFKLRRNQMVTEVQSTMTSLGLRFKDPALMAVFQQES